MQLSNYLFFTTMCEPALTFYTECGLGRVVEIMRHGAHASETMRGKNHALEIRRGGRSLLRIGQTTTRSRCAGRRTSS